jgi:hypothetical protein
MRRIIHREECDSTDEIVVRFQEIHDNLYLLNDKIEQVQKEKKKKKKGVINLKTLISMAVIAVALIATICYSVTVTDITHETVQPEEALVTLLRSKLTTVTEDIEAVSGLNHRGTGVWYFVDSGAGNAAAVTGTTVALAEATIERGINNCTASRGDVVFVLQGHTESATAADTFDADIAGITIVGLGVGSLKPTITFNAGAAECAIGADNVTLINLRFSPGTDTVLIALDVETGADWAHILSCEFTAGTTSTSEFSTSIQVGTSTGGVVANCLIDMGETSAVTGILFEASTGLIIRGNTIRGDYSTANINNATTLAEDILIEDNILWNGVASGPNAQPVIEVLADTSGITRRNYAVCNVANVAAAFLGAKLYNFGNYYNELTAGSATGFPFDLAQATTTTLSVGWGDEEN